MSRRQGKATSPVIAAGEFDAVLADLDGVVTKTAAVHAAAWKRTFDEFLERRAARRGETYVPFDIEDDYRPYVDGKPRYDGVESFLASRRITLPYGGPDDDPGEETVCGIGNRKNELFHDELRQQGVAVYDHALAFLRAARDHGLAVAVVSSSKNCEAVLRAAKLEALFDTRVDGVEVARLGLKGKPAPDMFLEAARRLRTEPSRAVVVEDAVAGVEAGRRGGFGLVIGVDRAKQTGALLRHGADVVVSDLGAIAFDSDEKSGRRVAGQTPSALDQLDEIARSAEGKRLAVFLDYDGTLTPIVTRPELAILAEDMRATVRELASLCKVAIVSGRDRADVEKLVGLDTVFYAGSHGFDISGPDGCRMQHEEGVKHEPALRQAEQELQQRLADIDGARVEGKRFAVATHYRLVAEPDVPRVKRIVEEVAAAHPDLRQTGGKKVVELRPRIEWDKGRAVLWLLAALDLDAADVLSVYLGDDLTDEDAFAALRERGLGILVGPSQHPTQARYVLRDPAEARVFLERLIDLLRSRG